MDEEERQKILQGNLKSFKDEEKLAFSILQKNRHSTAPPFQWFGPDPEPAKGECLCISCKGVI